jgi:eukaryotic-like serine/threonine-protein kinase
MSLAAGTKLGPYEVLAPLGAGGMGEVYKARDTRLDRIVAIKVLPPEWAADETAKQRFDREAKTIASLKHPHICILHDVGRLRPDGASASQGDEVDFLVMEYLEGETLTDRLARGPLPLQEALGVAIAIGDALDKAHRQGVIHRDLKPSNVMLTASGPKLLDFGLAKSQAALPAATSVTLPGTILGTMQYMAPEQLDGVEADRRTDIFGFGVIVHEMVTGKKAFEGKSQVLLISAIATSSPPPLSLVQPETPKALDDLVKMCLEKDPADRWQDARDVVAELRWIGEGGADADLGGPARKRGNIGAWLRRAAQVAGATAVIVLAWPAYLYMQAPPPPEEVRFRIARNLTAQPDETQGANSASGGAATFSRSDSAISPDGRTIVFAARSNLTDPLVLYVRPVDSVTPQRLAGTDDGTRPFWSPDSSSIAFVSRGKLKKVLANGGRPQDLCDVSGFMGGTWNGTGTILFGSASGIFRVSQEGGTAPELITPVDQAESGHLWPHFLPDGRHYLYLAKSSDAAKNGVYVAAIDSKDRKRVLAVDSNALYTDAGMLVFGRAGAVYAQRFSAETLTLSGDPARIADEVSFDVAAGKGDFDLSRDGVLIYYVSSTGAGAVGEESWDFQLAWADRNAQAVATVGPVGTYRGVEVSPNGQRVAVHRHDGKGGDLWVIEPPPQGQKRITFDATQDNASPVWSPAGDQIAFASKRNGKVGLYVTRSDGSGNDGDLLFESDLPKAPMAWPDNKRLVFWMHDAKTLGDIWILPLDGDKKPVPFLASSKNETHPQVSPDGKWIAYTSELTGRKEVYVQPFPSGTGRWQISPDAGLGGDWPRWRKDSQMLYYHTLGNAGAYGAYTNGAAFAGPVLEVSIKAVGGAIEAGTPKEVLRFLALRYAHPGSDYHTYGVSADGQRFLAYQRVLTAGGATGQIVPEVPIPGLTVAMNWAQTIKK